jgi:hypothetical protein
MIYYSKVSDLTRWDAPHCGTMLPTRFLDLNRRRRKFIKMLLRRHIPGLRPK